ncbi:unnamed protein product [Fusarium graminearum]|nr:unnamed protein product [Fusarium graminearum]
MASFLRNACDHCRQSKLKCSGGKPACSRCARRHLSCDYSPLGPRGRPRLTKHRPSSPAAKRPRTTSTPTLSQDQPRDPLTALLSPDNETDLFNSLDQLPLVFGDDGFDMPSLNLDLQSMNNYQMDQNQTHQNSLPSPNQNLTASNLIETPHFDDFMASAGGLLSSVAKGNGYQSDPDNLARLDHLLLSPPCLAKLPCKEDIENLINDDKVNTVVDCMANCQESSNAFKNSCTCPSRIMRLQLIVMQPGLSRDCSSIQIDAAFFTEEAVQDTYRDMVECRKCTSIKLPGVMLSVLLVLDWVITRIHVILDDNLDTTTMRPNRPLPSTLWAEKPLDRQPLQQVGMGRSRHSLALYMSNKISIGKWSLPYSCWRPCLARLIQIRLKRIQRLVHEMRAQQSRGPESKNLNSAADPLEHYITSIEGKIDMLFGMIEVWENI